MNTQKNAIKAKQIQFCSNGKVQRDKLPSPDALTHGGDTSDGVGCEEESKPSNELEEAVRGAFIDVLRLSSEQRVCCVRDTFFALGGNSISAIKLLFKLKSVAVKISEKKGEMSV